MEEVDLVTRLTKRVGTIFGEKTHENSGKNLKRLQCIESIEIDKMQWRELDEKIEKMMEDKDIKEYNKLIKKLEEDKFKKEQQEVE
jgi:HD-like signal output (HDOD) protein